MHFKWILWAYVCLFDNTSEICHWMGYYGRGKKMQAFLFLQLIVLMHFVPVEFFILEIKGYNKNPRKKCSFGLSGEAALTWRYDFSIAGLQDVGFWYLQFSRRSFGLSSSFTSFFLTCVFCSFFILFVSIISFLKRRG